MGYLDRLYWPLGSFCSPFGGGEEGVSHHDPDPHDDVTPFPEGAGADEVAQMVGNTLMAAEEGQARRAGLELQRRRYEADLARRLEGSLSSGGWGESEGLGRGGPVAMNVSFDDIREEMRRMPREPEYGQVGEVSDVGNQVGGCQAALCACVGHVGGDQGWFW
jgi:hypothetical protein